MTAPMLPYGQRLRPMAGGVGRMARAVPALAALALSTAMPGQTAPFDDERPRLPGREGDGLASVWTDLDGDGRADLVRATGRGVDVLLQDAAGRFRRAQSTLALPLPPEARVVALAAAPLVRTAGAPDVVVGVTGAASLLLVNDGSGRLQLAPVSPFGRPPGSTGATTQVVVADFDRRHGDDVLVLHDGALPQLFVRAAGGGFTEQGAAWFPAGFFPQSPVGVAADVTGDGWPDLVLVRRGLSATPILFAGQGGATFGLRPLAFAAVPPESATALCAAELTGDALVDLALGGRGGLRVLANQAAGVFAVAPIVGFTAGNVRGLAAGDVDRSGRADLVVLHDDGSVAVALARAGAFPALAAALPPAPRHELHLVDLEPDGDPDLHVLGARVEDALLLGDGAGAWRATEDVTIPAGALAGPLALALLDANADGDPDLVGYDAGGAPAAFVNDGAARFAPRPAVLPSLAPSTVLGVAPLAAAGSARVDLAVLGTRPHGVRFGLSLLVQLGGALVDETAFRWPAPTSNLSGFAVADVVRAGPGTTGFDDVVAIDDGGQLRLFVNNGGAFAAHPTAFGPTAIFAASKLLLAHVDGDARVDLVVLRQGGSPEVFLGAAAGAFARVAQPIVGSFPARDGIAAELTGDGTTDLLLLARTPSPAIFLLEGRGDGTFVDATARAPGPLPTALTSLAALGPAARPFALVFASATEPDVLFTRAGGMFAGPLPLPGRGSLHTAAILTGDLDGDGDEDLVLSRADTLPRVLLDQSLQLCAGVAQLNRRARVRVRAPRPGAIALLGSVGSARVPLPPFGTLRLSPLGLQQLLAVPIGAAVPFDLTLAVLPSWPEVELPLQVAYLDGTAGAVRLGNLEWLTIVGY